MLLWKWALFFTSLWIALKNCPLYSFAVGMKDILLSPGSQPDIQLVLGLGGDSLATMFSMKLTKCTLYLPRLYAATNGVTSLLIPFTSARKGTLVLIVTVFSSISTLLLLGLLCLTAPACWMGCTWFFDQKTPFLFFSVHQVWLDYHLEFLKALMTAWPWLPLYFHLSCHL